MSRTAARPAAVSDSPVDLPLPMNRQFTINDRQLTVDDSFKLLLGLSAAQEDAIDEVGWGAGNTNFVSLPPICFDVAGKFAARNAGLKLSFIQLQGVRASDQAGFIQLGLIRKKAIVILPELTLFSRAASCLGRLLRARMDLHQREVAEG